MFPLACHF